MSYENAPLYPFLQAFSNTLNEGILSSEAIKSLCATAVALPDLTKAMRYALYYHEQQEADPNISHVAKHIFEQASRRYVLVPPAALEAMGAAMRASKTMEQDETSWKSTLRVFLGSESKQQGLDLLAAYYIAFETKGRLPIERRLITATKIKDPIWRSVAISHVLVEGPEAYTAFADLPKAFQREIFDKFMEGAAQAAQHNDAVQRAGIMLFYKASQIGYLNPNAKSVSDLLKTLDREALKALGHWLPKHYVNTLAAALQDYHSLKAFMGSAFTPFRALKAIQSIFSRNQRKASPFREAQKTIDAWMKTIQTLNGPISFKHLDSLVGEMRQRGVGNPGVLFGVVMATAPYLVPPSPVPIQSMPNLRALAQTIGIASEDVRKVLSMFLTQAYHASSIHTTKDRQRYHHGH